MSTWNPIETVPEDRPVDLLGARYGLDGSHAEQEFRNCTYRPGIRWSSTMEVVQWENFDPLWTPIAWRSSTGRPPVQRLAYRRDIEGRVISAETVTA